MIRTNATPQQVDGRKRPLVWVKKIALYETIDPLTEIRQIGFTTGLNIIQGEAVESDGAFQSGHGIGKTTVCRLIRYCLGEKSFGQKHVVEEVKHCFPNAYVGAVIVLNGAEWAVLRPLGNRIKEYALEGVTLDGLVKAKGAHPFDAFCERLSGLVLAGVPVGESLSSGQTLLWLHVLAMCSRDQESRYDRFWNWRHTRSESGTPKFNKPRVDAGLCVRAIIGLLDPAEAKQRTKLEDLEASLEQIQDQIRSKRAEPGFHVTRLRGTLSADFGVDDATDAPLDGDSLLGLPMKLQSRLEALRHEVAQVEAQIAPLDRQISLASASLLEPAELAGQLRAASEITGDGNDALLADIERLRSIRQFIRDAESALCRFGDVIIGQCSYVQARASQFDDEIRDRQRSTLPTVSEREQAAARLAEQAERLDSTVRQIQQRLDATNRQKNVLMEQRRNLNDQIRRIPSVLEEIKDWTAILGGEKANTPLQRLEREAAAKEAEIEATRRNLAELIALQVRRARLFEGRFDAVVRQTLSDEFMGVVEIEEEGISFEIKPLSGEAYGTLAVLLADVALLFESDSAHSQHPGILIHDSPREADLNLRIYHRLLDVAEAHMRKAGQDDDSPYQYIVTTTTPPSEQLQGTSVTRIRLSSGTGSLFGRQLEDPTPAQTQLTLFDGEGGA